MPLVNAELIVPGDLEATLRYAVEHFITSAQDAIQDHGYFAVALSGGSTPKAIYELICQPQNAEEIEWDKVHLFWSDERPVPPIHPESNYHMAMKAGFDKMLIPPHHIHRMKAEGDIKQEAKHYDKTIRQVLGNRSFDLVMLGMGDDGHTASLFPETDALKVQGVLTTANFIPAKNSWRMTLTFDAINASSHIAVYVFGASKKPMLNQVFSTAPHLPCQFVGTPDNPALWISDLSAAT